MKIQKYHTTRSITMSHCDEYEQILFKYNIINMVKPKNIFTANVVDLYFKNKNMVLLVVESMCTGILMPVHIARKFKYITNVLEYEDYETPIEGGMKVCIICDKWDTHNWSFTKLSKFYDWFEYIENKTCDELTEKYKKYHQYDLHFIVSMCWTNDEEDIEETKENILAI